MMRGAVLWLRRLLLILGGAAAILILLAAGALLLLQTAPGKRLAAARLADELAAATGFAVEIGAIDGPLPLAARVTDVRLGDAGGTWLTADRLAIGWRPLALLAGRLEITRIVAGEIALARLPQIEEQPDDDAPGIDLVPGLPRLPLPVEIAELGIERLALAPALLGERAVLGIAGSASLGGDARDARLALAATRLDGPDGRADLRFGQAGDPPVLTLAATIEEPAGGLVARALGLPGLPAVSLRLAGDGPASAWRGRLAAGAGDARLAADLSLALGKTLGLAVTGNVRSAGLLAPAIGAYLPPTLDLAARLSWRPEERFAIDQFSLRAPDARVEIAGAADLAADELHGTIVLDVDDAARWQPLLAPAAIRRGLVRGSLAGTLDRPTFDLTATVDRLSLPGFAAGQAEATLAGSLALRDRRAVTGLAVTGEGTLAGLAIGFDPRLAALAGPAANWSFEGALDLSRGDLRLERARLASGPLRLGASGVVGAFGRDVAADIEAEVADIAPLAATFDLAASGRASLKAHVSGDATRSRLTVELDGGLAEFGSQDERLAALLGRAPTVRGRIGATDTGFDLHNVALDGAGVRLTADGPLGADGRTVDLAIAAEAAEIAGIAALFDVPARGRFAADLTLRRAAADPSIRPSVRIAGNATLDGFALDAPGGNLLGETVRASLEGRLHEGGIDLAAARIEGVEATLSASGHAGATLDLAYRLALPRLAALSALAGLALAGSGEVSGKVTGAAQDPVVAAQLAGRDLRVADLSIGRLAGNVSARHLATRPEGEARLEAAFGGQRLSLAGRYRVVENGGLALDGLRLTAPKTALAGDLAISPAGLLDGRLRGDAGDLRLVGSLIGERLAGAATVDLAFKAGAKGQGIEAKLEARDLSLGAGDTPMTAARATLDAALADAFGAPSGRADIAIAGAAIGGLSIEAASLAAEGGMQSMRLRLEATGERGQPFAVDTAGELAAGGAEQRLRLDRLDGSFGPVEVRLNAPLTLARAARGVEIAGLDAAIGDGRLTGGGRLGARSDLALRLADLPLDIVTTFAPAVSISGSASADLAIAGPSAAPTATARIRLADLREGGTKVGDAVGIDGTIDVEVKQGRGNLVARLGGEAVEVDANLAAPVTFRLQPFALSLAPGAPMSGRVEGRIDLALLPRIVDLHGDALGGRLDADLTIAGTPEAPRLTGAARIAGGSYESAENGTVLREVTAALAGDDDRILLRSLTATDGGEGRLSASGSVTFGRDGRALYDGALSLQRFTALRRREATAVASGRLRLDEAPGGLAIAGDVTIDQAELRIPERLPPKIVKLDVIEVNVPPARQAALRQQAAQRTDEAAGLPVALDVTARIPGRAFLRGRGIESEWRGKLRVKGTLGNPDVTGRLEVVRGDVNVIGKVFRVEEGTVTFIGGGNVDPELDLTATGEAADLTARIHITGRASEPKLTVASDSGLPQEEVMSRLLFGTGTGGLSPLQAAQLAQAGAGLLGVGGGTGFLDRLRRGTGLDVLTVESTGSNPGDSAIKAGKYVSDDVFVKIEQGLTPESRKVGVEVRVLPRVTVEGDVGGQGSGEVGVNFRYDY